MNEREQDIVFFCHHVFPPPLVNHIEFIDVGQRLGRICKDAIAEHDNSIIGNPWVSEPPPFTSTTRLLMRYVVPDSTAMVVRLAEPFELMLSVGFSSHMFDAKQVAEMFGAGPSDMHVHNLFWTIALSSVTVSHYAALRMELLSTAGRFHSGNQADVMPAEQPAAMPSSQAASDVPFSQVSTICSGSLSD